MRIIKYASLCEDAAQREFLRLILPLLSKQISDDNIIFEIEEQYPIWAKNNKQVDSNCEYACNEAFVRYKVDLFFLFRDADTHLIKRINERYEKFDKYLPSQFRHKCIIMLPVQCIEHWFLYLKYYNENPSSTKNPTFDSKPNKDAKKEVYGSFNASNEKQKPIIQELMTTPDIDKLQNHSESFKRFQSDIKLVVNQFLQTK